MCAQLTRDRFAIAKFLYCIVSYVDYRFITCVITCCSVVFGVTMILLAINISSSSRTINKLRRLLPAISVTTCVLAAPRRIDNSWPVAVIQHAVKPDMGSESPPLKGSPLEYRHKVWCSKTRMVWLPHGEKNSEDTITRFDRIHERDGQTHRQTDRQTHRRTSHNGIGRAYAEHRAAKR